MTRVVILSTEYGVSIVNTTCCPARIFVSAFVFPLLFFFIPSPSFIRLSACYGPCSLSRGPGQSGEDDWTHDSVISRVKGGSRSRSWRRHVSFAPFPLDRSLPQSSMNNFVDIGEADPSCAQLCAKKIRRCGSHPLLTSPSSSSLQGT